MKADFLSRIDYNESLIKEKKYNSPEKSSNPWSEWSSAIDEASKNRWNASARWEASLLLRLSWFTSSCVEAAILKVNFDFWPVTFLTPHRIKYTKMIVLFNQNVFYWLVHDLQITWMWKWIA